MTDSYRYPLRLPLELGKAVSEFAQQHRQSFNLEVVNALQRAVDQKMDFVRSVGEMMGHQGRMYQEMAKIVEANSATLEMARQSARQLTEGLQPALESYSVLATNLSQLIFPALDQMRAFQDQFAELGRRIAELMPATAEVRLVTAYLAERGWFLAGDGALFDCKRLVRLVEVGDESAIEGWMITRARELTAELRDKATEKWPHRADFLADAFWAHSQGRYSLSIPSFLAQADGICQELFGVQLYGKERKDRSPATRAVVCTHFEDISTDGIDFTGALLYPLLIGFSLSVNTKDRVSDTEINPLNRHGVLHGIDLDYASEGNSLRAIVLLGYLCMVAELLEDEDEAERATT